MEQTINKTLLFLLLGLSCFLSIAQTQGKVFDRLTIKSEILKGERKYAVYLPPDYESSSRRYPVLYLLHGLGDDQTGWVQFGEVKRIADEAILTGNATSMIIVMPDAKTGRSGYFNWITDQWNYEDFFFEEFIPEIEQTYHIKSQKEFRAIAGLSMGGGGTFLYAMHHPELFGAACPLSSWFWWESVEDLKVSLHEDGLTLEDERAMEFYNYNQPLELVKKMSIEDLNSVRWYIDCGDDDFLFKGNSLMHIIMRERDVNHQYRVRDGAHTWSYWREALPEVLRFVTESFHKK